jgi:thioredoxin 1
MSKQIENITTNDFEEKVLGSDKPVLVDFWAPWCGPCRIVGPVLEDIARENGEVIKVAKVNVDENQELAARFGIRGIPTVMLFDGGQVRETLVGARPRADFESLVSRAAGMPAN